MNRNNLVAAPTVDKNGKLTTVYRRQESSTGGGAPLPTPAVRDENLIRNISFLFDSVRSDKAAKMSAASTLQQYPQEALQSIHDVITDEELSDIDRDILTENIFHMISRGSTLPFLEEALLFYPMMNGSGRMVSEKVVQSLRSYPQLPKSFNYARESDEVQEKCAAIVKVSKALFYSTTAVTNTNGVMRIADSNLVDLVLEFPSRADDVISIIHERMSFDPTLIQEVLTAEASALSSGTL